MTRELNRVTLALLAGFALVVIASWYWSVYEAGDLLTREDNARNVIAAQHIARGTIVDQDGEVLAYSEPLASGVQQRIYPHPEAAGAVGYYSFQYGAAGIEQGYDAVLRGDDVGTDWDRLADDLLHRPQQGGDVRSTVDLDVQGAIVDAMGGYSGAAVVAHVPTGRVLAMVSRPGYDPNTLDADWERLTVDEETSPLLNRVTAGLYQPGSALETVMLSAILGAYSNLDEEAGFVLNSDLPQAQVPVTVNGLRLECLPDAPGSTMTLAGAYAFGCPGPFADALGDPVTPERMWERLEVLGLLAPAELAGFTTAAPAVPEPLTAATPDEQLTAFAVGQGALTLTPLHMLQVVAAVANQGNGVPLHVVDAIREPDADAWTPVEISMLHPALLRADVAEVVRLTMLQAAAQSPYVRAAQRGDLVLYGHSGVAYAGPDATPYSWFLGFVDQTEADEMESIAAVVVLEGVGDPAVAADVAGDAFAAAATQADALHDSEETAE